MPKRKSKKSPTADSLKTAVLRLLAQQNRPLSKREIARHLGLKGFAARVDLKELLFSLVSDNEITRTRNLYALMTNGETLSIGQFLPIIIDHTDEDGRLLARLPQEETLIHLKAHHHRHLTAGMSVLAKLTGIEDGVWEADVVRYLEKPTQTRLGIVQRNRQYWMIIPLDSRRQPPVRLFEKDKLQEGEVVVYSAQQNGATKILERLGNADNPRIFSILAIHEYSLSFIFPDDAITEAAEGRIPALDAHRIDLRDIDFVTIDGEDARDFDDAVWAAPHNDGWKLWVAIADVSYYVKPDSSLDREAYHRGNSVYFPDRVVPMLPEALSNELCSLKPNQDRACLAVEIILNPQGKMTSFRFQRGLMRSRARLTYTQVQAIIDGKGDAALNTFVTPLYGAYRCLLQERHRRGTLELNIPERQILFDDQGDIANIVVRQPLESYRLIEEFMIAANVAAARVLSQKDYPCLYRIHDSPDHLRVANLCDLVKKLKFSFPKTTSPSPHQFNDLLEKTTGTPSQRLIHDLVLRTQAQARYSPMNIGHFGLSLRHYCHFTSPIRRYADLVVHRALIEALNLDTHDQFILKQRPQLMRISDHISQTERTAATAERDTSKRFALAFAMKHHGERVQGTIVGVTRSGLFVEIESIGAEGFLPKALLPAYLRHDPATHRLSGRRNGLSFQLGQKIAVIITDINPLANEMRLRLG